MDIDRLLIDLITNSLCTSSILLVAGFLGRSIVERWLQRNFEKYKSDLEINNAQEIERLKSDLELINQIQGTKYLKLYEKRGEFIESLYQQMVLIEMDLNTTISTLKDRKAKNQPLDITKSDRSASSIDQTRVNETWLHFNQNRIYLDEKICTKIEMLLLRVVAMIIVVTCPQEPDEDGFDYPVILENLRAKIRNSDILEAATALQEELLAARKDIESEFRKMIGVATN